VYCNIARLGSRGGLDNTTEAMESLSARIIIFLSKKMGDWLHMASLVLLGQIAGDTDMLTLSR
jgi:hypothetical protein